MYDWILYTLIGYFTLYAVVWLHEVGHSFWYCVFGCKKNVFNVSVKPYIFFSTPEPVDPKKEAALSKKQILAVSYGGVGANALWIIVSGTVLNYGGFENRFVLTALWLFLTLHFAEIVSYLFIGDIFPVSDMKAIAEAEPALRWINLAAGVVLTVSYLCLFKMIPSEFFTFTLTINAVVVLGMCAGRIVFGLREKKTLNK